MKKHKKPSELRTVMQAAVPYVALVVIMFSAAFSQGSWANFFSRLPIFALLGVPFCYLVSAQVVRQRPAAYASGGWDDDGTGTGYSPSAGHTVNPGTGLPTIAGPGSPDIGGNQWGSM